MPKQFVIFSLFLLGIFSACNNEAQSQQKTSIERASLSDTERSELAEAIFAGGCFWCTEAVFERVEGVKEVISGYSGGDSKNPTYRQVSAGLTKYAEAVKIYYDPKVISYPELLEIFFATHDPTQLNRQGPDVGAQYRSEVFYQNDTEKQQTLDYIAKLNKSGKFSRAIVTKVTQFKSFYDAEGYHQDYYEHNPGNPYIIQVTRPKVEKFLKQFKTKLKKQYKSS